MELGKIIKQERMRRGWTRIELSRQTQGRVSESTIKRIENQSEHNAETGTVRALKQALGIEKMEI